MWAEAAASIAVDVSVALVGNHSLGIMPCDPLSTRLAVRRQPLGSVRAKKKPATRGDRPSLVRLQIGDAN